MKELKDDDMKMLEKIFTEENKLKGKDTEFTVLMRVLLHFASLIWRSMTHTFASVIRRLKNLD